VPSGRRLPPHHLLLRNQQQIAPILRQQIKRVSNVWNILNITVLEALAMERFKQLAGGSDTL
jgi:hypothetical protein